MTERMFEWDDKKNEINVVRHGIRFEQAALIFDDENRLEFYDEDHSQVEERINVIGLVEKILFVVYTERKFSTRIISARKATKEEADEYYHRNHIE